MNFSLVLRIIAWYSDLCTYCAVYNLIFFASKVNTYLKQTEFRSILIYIIQWHDFTVPVTSKTEHAGFKVGTVGYIQTMCSSWTMTGVLHGMMQSLTNGHTSGEEWNVDRVVHSCCRWRGCPPFHYLYQTLQINPHSSHSHYILTSTDIPEKVYMSKIIKAWSRLHTFKPW